MLVAPLVFRSPAWVALMGRAAVCAGGRRPAREIATREPDGSEWSISRPALALPPPSGTAAWPSGAAARRRGLFRFTPGLSRPHY